MRDFELTAAWQHQVYPRRGTLGVSPVTAVPTARGTVDEYLEQSGNYLDRLLLFAGPGNEPLLRAAHAWRDGAADASPLGAAVVAAALMNRDRDCYTAPFADVWIAERGLAFAAAAAVELLALTFSESGHDLRFLRAGEIVQRRWWATPELLPAWRVRTALAAAPEAEYARVVEILAGYRSRHEYHRFGTSLLVPTQAGWVAADLDAALQQHDVYRGIALTQCLTEPDQLALLDRTFSSGYTFQGAVKASPHYIATLLDALGTQALEMFLRWLDGDRSAGDDGQRLLEAIAQMPSEAAVRALADRAGRPSAEAALLESAGRFPGLALGVLAERGGRGQLADLLRAHVRGHRDLAAAWVVGRPPGAQRVQAILDEIAAIGQAPAGAVPAVLMSPPWLHRAAAARPIVLTGLSCTDEPSAGESQDPVLQAEGLTRRKSVRAGASAWLLRHADVAARALVPPALGRVGAARRQAENALLHLASHGHGDAVRSAGRVYGDEAAAAVEALLSRDPLTQLPARIPAVPSWAAPALLPSVRLAGGAGALPVAAVEHLVTMFALSHVEQPYAGLDLVRAAVVPEDLPVFAWGLFQRWFVAGADPKENWVLDALALTGDDEVVRQLTPLILSWPGEGGHARAVAGVNVLAAIGSDVALMHLNSIAQRAKFKGLKSAAQERMASLAADLGLTADQLADRLVPGLGLDDDGSLLLDYGPRQFVVGFDEELRPYVTDTAGQRLKNLPRPGTKDDPDLAPAAYQQFSGLKKDVRKIAADLVQRLEQSMVSGRRWSGSEFRQFLVGHPLVCHVVRRLVWGVYDDGRLVGALRVAEDRSFADLADLETKLPDDAVVGVAHPLHLGPAVEPWAGVFADYEILQPFPQLDRPVHTLTPSEAEHGVLERFEGLEAPNGTVLGLERRGWRREEPDDVMQMSVAVSFSSGLKCSVRLDPGFVIGFPTDADVQTLVTVRLHHGSPEPFADRATLPLLGDCDPVAVSEILGDLTGITGG
ncbi:DUF4132 domain-containing protein [Kineosporia sp. NBRC 101731]|uniref:DUF4132 domain-containing protein n=1 Tax=Kineosporia sp. NBRC 101731 TaxID=3032199 RepID=UPI0024A31CF7|nr:DUF4132 domain-containing protein [Kineosporia sp. NBRC 101731]GLY32645.1 hypothetical protein Kisp02_60100 [Kineosporia sp. NBRC 101731]